MVVKMDLKGLASVILAIGIVIFAVVIFPLFLMNNLPIATNQQSLNENLLHNGAWFDEQSESTWIRCNCLNESYLVVTFGNRTKDRDDLCRLLNLSINSTWN